jgi:hypothetical protein
MAVHTRTFHIAACDVCGAKFGEDGDYPVWDDTPELALDQVAEDADWTRDGQRVVCPRSDTDHYLARGAESPALLRPGADAMTVRHAA